MKRVTLRAACRGWLGLYLATSLASGQVVLNEIMVDNRTTVSSGDAFPDYVELYNPAAQTLNLGGMSLTDDFTQPRKFVFPSNTFLAPGGYLIVWCDSQINTPGLHAGFALDNKGETVGLYSSNGVLVNSVVFGLQLPDLALGRIPNATGTWTLTIPTPALPNVVQPLGSSDALRLNEWMAKSSTGLDWFEVYNAANLPVGLGGLLFTTQIGGSPTNRAVPALSFIGGNDFIQFIADRLAIDAADHVDFKLNAASGNTLTLYAANRLRVLDQVAFGPQTEDVSQGRLPDGGNNVVFFRTNRPTPAASNFLPVTNVVVNEVLTHTDSPLEDAVELFNPTTETVDISNWWLSNNRDDPMRYRIPAGTIIPAGGFKVFYEYQFDPNDMGFTYNSYESGEVVFFSGDVSGALTGYRLRQSFDAAQNGISFGRYQTSQGVDFVAMSQHSFGIDKPTTLPQFRTGTGKTNAYPRIGPVIINELMYHPPDMIGTDKPEDNVDDEYIELYNVTNGPTPLYDPLYPTNQWRIRNGISYDFSSKITMAARSYLLLVSFNPSNSTKVAAFRAKFNVPTNVPVIGPYSGRLDNRGEVIELLKPDPPQPLDRPKPGLVPFILVDRVEYMDRDPWPRSPDGSGHSLQRRSSMVYGNDPVHWLGSPPTAGRANAVEAPQIEGARKAGNSIFRFQFTALGGVPYGVDRIDNLTSVGITNLTNIAAMVDARTIQIQDYLTSTNDALRFYRIKIPSQP